MRPLREHHRRPAEYDRLTAREHFLTDVKAGIADAEAGRLLTLAESRALLALRRKKVGLPTP